VPAAVTDLWWILVAGFVVALVLTAAIVASVILQQRRFLDAHRQFSARLLMAQEEERAWIARELHDDLIQRVGLLGHELQDVAGSLGVASRGAHIKLRGLEAELGDLSEEIRRLAHRMHPSVLDNLGLPVALQVLAEEVSGGGEILVRVVVASPPSKLSPPAALCLYRVAQEALRNVVKHAGVTEATVTLSCTQDGTLLEVADAGRGFDPGQSSARPGLGVRSMTERVHLFRGTLGVVSAPGRGTRLNAWLPMGET
jgi:two-component system, NarL family, sensor kinase